MPASASYAFRAIGDTGIRIEFGAEMNEEVNERVLSAFERLMSHRPAGAVDLVPAYCTLAVFYEASCTRSWSQRVEEIQTIIGQGLTTVPSSKTPIHIPVCYDNQFAPDLERVAARLSMDPATLVEKHHSREYRVYMIGFLPGFAYMGSLDSSLYLPRKATPVSVPAGSVGMAGLQTGIYPEDSPGGWQIIGRTPLRLFDPDPAKLSFLHPGDRIRFKSINADEFEIYKDRSS